MRTATPAVFAVLLLAATGCGAGAPAGSSAATTTTTSIASCGTAVGHGVIVTDTLIEQGCTDQNGTKRLGKVRTCENGQRLWEMDGMIGLSGGPMLPENIKGDDGLTARFLNEFACNR